MKGLKLFKLLANVKSLTVWKMNLKYDENFEHLFQSQKTILRAIYFINYEITYENF